MHPNLTMALVDSRAPDLRPPAARRSRSRGRSHRGLTALLAALAALGLWAAQAPQADAAPYKANGCTVDPLAPFPDGTNTSNETLARFRVTFQCAAGVSSISVAQEGYEDDGLQGKTRLFTYSHGPYTVPAGGGSGTWSYLLPVKYWDGVADPYVELFHQVRFRVCSGPVCAWAPSSGAWVKSPITTFRV